MPTALIRNWTLIVIFISYDYKHYTMTTSITSMIYYAFLLCHIWPEDKKILQKYQNSFWNNQPITSRILSICQIIEGIRAKDLKAALLFINSSKAFDSNQREKMEQIWSTYGLSKETVTIIMMLYQITKAIVHSLGGDTDSFNIGVLHDDDMLAPYMLICLDYIE